MYVPNLLYAYPIQDPGETTTEVPKTEAIDDEEIIETRPPSDALSVVFSCALYRLHNQQDQELLWLHYFQYKTLKGIDSG